MKRINTISYTPLKVQDSEKAAALINIRQSDIELLMDLHELSEDARSIIEK